MYLHKYNHCIYPGTSIPHVWIGIHYDQHKDFNFVMGHPSGLPFAHERVGWRPSWTVVRLGFSLPKRSHGDIFTWMPISKTNKLLAEYWYGSDLPWFGVEETLKKIGDVILQGLCKQGHMKKHIDRYIGASIAVMGMNRKMPFSIWHIFWHSIWHFLI